MPGQVPVPHPPAPTCCSTGTWCLQVRWLLYTQLQLAPPPGTQTRGGQPSTGVSLGILLLHTLPRRPARLPASPVPAHYDCAGRLLDSDQLHNTAPYAFNPRPALSRLPCGCRKRRLSGCCASRAATPWCR